ncbi:hypothetical protein [Methylomicrobium sp. Wu6]|uniref:hypothetical protein n=1 Tax=Methylomicrobium sp. Wu6 TaxID=3107928 RepID=UPI002DD64AA5|nr:hypothetical protein [Methylomicrobium sp. Wu6]MEC4749406.1 hypothetical protein [Methylomicrobium sp. Wu6]
MTDQLDLLINKIKDLENELLEELQKQQEEFSYEIQQRRIHFEESIIQRHKRLTKELVKFLQDSPWLNILSAPIIWSCLLPALLMDMVVTLYQAICFPIYGIPKAKREHYIVFDTQYLNYLNLIEKLNCAYCSYFNGLIAYIQEIAARTEQYWCPIKHARRIGTLHSRYQKFFNYGDGENYRAQIELVRRDFKDLE